MPSASHSVSLVTGAQNQGTNPGTGSGGSSGSGSSITYGTVYQPYIARSVWNTAVPNNPAIDSNSANIVSAVLGPGTYNEPGTMPLVVNLAIYGYGQPCYIADASTPKKPVSGSMAFGNGVPNVIPWNSAWSANSGADAKINIFDTSTGYVYEFNGFNNTNGNLSAEYGVRRSYATEVGDAYTINNEGRGPTGSGLDQVGGMIRINDIQQGSINHALNFLTSNPMGPYNSNTFRYPATNCDGTRTTPNGLIEGMRIQLDPSVNLDTISGMGAGEKMVAKALQTYGAYCTDTGRDNNLACGFYCEKPTGTDPYPGVGITSDWFQLTHIPRNRLRVLAESVTPRVYP